MISKVTPLLLVVLFLASFCFGAPRRPGPADSTAPSLEKLLRAYHGAEDHFHLNNPTAADDSIALSGYERVIAALDKYPVFAGRDTLLVQCYLKKGILLDVRLDYHGAKEAYIRAMGLPQKRDDSLIFVASVYAGASFYNLNIFDSANYYLLRAEALADRFPATEEAVRLYNTLGVLYHDNGNYLQAKNYFSRALQIIETRKPFDTAFAVNIQTNIATSYYRLGLFRESLAIYNKILSYHMFTDLIHMNMGMAYASLHEYREALGWYRRVDDRQIPGVLNEMADVQRQWNRPDSSAWYLDRLRSPGRTGKINELDLGINDMLRGFLLADQRRYVEALAPLQRAIIVFSRGFNKMDLDANPSDFTGTFACYRLFDALFKKATVFDSLYRSQPMEQYLRGGYEAYKSALSLLRYIEKSYDTDDAKIFLKKRNTTLYQGALSACLKLYRLHPDQDYLSQAFMISEKNKASIMTANLRQGSGKTGGIVQELLQKERNIKYNIARLNVRSETAAGEREMQAIAREKAAYQIDLSRVQKALEENGNFYRLKYDDSSPGIAAFQHSLDGRQALISLAETADALHVFVLTRSSFSYVRIDSLSALEKDVESWLQLLKTAENGRKFGGEAIAKGLYRRLILPLRDLAGDKEEWIIVPDGFLYFLPFESLPSDAPGKTMLETTTISYQLSSQLLLSGSSSSSIRDGGQVLAFAPFVTRAGSFSGAPDMIFERLAASGQEIAGLPGKSFVDSLATKARFLKEINAYPIVHLATHAVSSINNAAASFIAFYPVKGSQIEDCLFLEELYGLDMNATSLVIISACETGQGELVSNEGVLSLARAFAYAGCASTVNSLWKADDLSTSKILQKFHVYLEKGYSKARALRQAKLDYLHSDALNKSPAFWSHLILIGNTDPVYARHSYKWMIGGMAVLLAAGIWIAGRRRKRS